MDEAVVAAIRRWIESGAPLPEGERPERDPKDHWAFQGPRASGISAEALERAGHPIDAFLREKQAERGLVVQKLAPPEIQLRRVYLDLVGLPPTRSERNRFLSDPSPDAYERLVDRLLASPQYAERWGRHWMDIWRYTDWYGLGAQLRFSQKHIWHWRDWILESLNTDRGYDQMIREMLAGDELAPTDPETLRATGFLARNYYLFNRNTWLDQTIEHTSRAFLGLTMQCARCHDHKYDALTQEDYYRFRAFFEPHQVRLDPVPGETDLEQDGLPRAFDAHPDAPTYLFRRGNDKDPDESRVLTAAIPEIFQDHATSIQASDLPAEAFFPGLQEFVLRDHIADIERQLKAAELRREEVGQRVQREALSGKSVSRVLQREQRARELEVEALGLQPAALRFAHTADRSRHGLTPERNPDRIKRQADEAAVRYRIARARADVALREWELGVVDAEKEEKKQAEAKKKLEQAKSTLEALEEERSRGELVYTSLRPSLKALESPAETEASRRKPYAQRTTGRRTALAKWVTDRRNPLTARVAVNHIWLRHFGQSFVSEMTDFGRRSAAPVQQDLLDHLAVYLMENDWRMKPLHRLIVTSAAYRRSSSTRGADPTTLERDPDNDYYWRRRPVRMESQVVRDSMRHLAGALDLAIGGPSIDPDQGENQGRRSLYFLHSRDQQHPFLAMFDDAEILACYRRSESILPQQALALVNSGLALDLAEQVARRLGNELASSTDESFIESAFQEILGMMPNEEERRLCQKLLVDTMVHLGDRSVSDPKERARRNLVQALFNHNDFITIR